MIRSSKDPDHDLVRACLDPDDDRFEAAFGELYDRYRDRVFSIAYRMLGTTSDAMDVAQESFSLLFRKLSSFRFDSKFSTWLFRLVVNCCVDHRRREASRPASSLSENSVDTETESGDPVAAAESSELEDHVQESLQRLSPKLRAVLILRYIEGQSYDELSQSLEISLGTVKSRLARAHLAFENVLDGTLASFDYPFDDQFQRRSERGSTSEGVA